MLKTTRPPIVVIAALIICSVQTSVSAKETPAIDLSKNLRAYQQDVLKATSKVSAKKRNRLDPNGLKSTRARGMQVIARANLKKAMVKRELDPIYDKLYAALVPSLEELYEADGELKAARQALLDAGADELDLVRAERVSALYAICESGADQRIVAGNLKLVDKLDPLERDAIESCNMRRVILGLNPLAIDTKLIECGRDHSKDMKEKRFFSHNSPVPGKKKFTKRAQNFNTTASAENIAKGQKTGTLVDQAWWHSPGHLKNMMNSERKRIGVGRFGRHWTQLFGN